MKARLRFAKRALTIGGLLVGTAGVALAPTAANARNFIGVDLGPLSIGIGANEPDYYVAPAPSTTYVAPAPSTYVAPAPPAVIYQAPAPTYQAPARTTTTTTYYSYPSSTTYTYVPGYYTSPAQTANTYYYGQ